MIFIPNRTFQRRVMMLDIDSGPPKQTLETQTSQDPRNPSVPPQVALSRVSRVRASVTSHSSSPHSSGRSEPGQGPLGPGQGPL